MAKTIIKKEVTDYGTIELKFIRRDDNYEESMRFDSEIQLKAFAYFLNQMLNMDAASVTIE